MELRPAISRSAGYIVYAVNIGIYFVFFTFGFIEAIIFAKGR